MFYIVQWIDDTDQKQQNIFENKERAEKELNNLIDEGFDAWLVRKPDYSKKS